MKKVARFLDALNRDKQQEQRNLAYRLKAFRRATGCGTAEEYLAKTKLNGKYKHSCNDWDGLWIDETCGEFECCSCFPHTQED